MRPVQLIDRWERYWRVMEARGTRMRKDRFSFDGKAVFELGCGPLLGWGPMAIFLGATEYCYYDPNIRRDVVEAEIIEERYFHSFHRELAANFGPRLDFDEFYTRVLTRSRSIDVNDPPEAGFVDITLSNSVLEHIAPDKLSALLRSIHALSRPGGCYFYAVDFGPHGLVERFNDLYLRPRAEGLNPGMINLLRVTEIGKLIAESGFTVESVPYKMFPVDADRIHPSWKPFSINDLMCGVAFFVGVKSRDEQC